MNLPDGGGKTIRESPIINDFDKLWGSIKATYTRELSDLVYSEIPNEKVVALSFRQIIDKLDRIGI